MAAQPSDGFSIIQADALRFPVLISVPHAGREYPPEIFDNLRLPPASLVRLEDRYADLLAREAIADGFPAIIAHRARAWIDLNRDEQDIDVEMIMGRDHVLRTTPGVKQRGGLGLIPRRLAGEGEIWKRPIHADSLELRLASFHRPYHKAVRQILMRMRDHFGVAILLDLHSMPPINTTHGGPAPRFVVGDRFGRSASNLLSELLLGKLRAFDFPAALNHPYSGDHVLRHHADVQLNIHAIQIEVDRSLYLDSSLREPGTHLGSIAQIISQLAHALADEVWPDDVLLAAE